VIVYALGYDIHEDCRLPNGRRVPDPSGHLHGIAVRFQFSVWLVTHDHIPYNLLHTWTQAGVTWDLLKFDASETQKQVALALRRLQDRVREIRESVAQSVAAFDADLEIDIDADGEDLTPAEYAAARDQAQRRYQRRTNRALRDAESALAAAEQAAATFGIGAQALSLSQSRTAINLARFNIGARINAYASMTVRLAKVDQALLKSARRDRLHPLVGLDRLQDAGEDVTSEREAFEE
jgi:hypothetical protein